MFFGYKIILKKLVFHQFIFSKYLKKSITQKLKGIAHHVLFTIFILILCTLSLN